MENKKSEPIPPSISSVVTISALAGAVTGGVLMTAAAVLLRSRGFSLHRTSSSPASADLASASEKRLHSLLAGLRQEITQTISTTESRLGSKLQTQERAIGARMSNHYTDLNDRLDTINAARVELKDMTRKMDELQTIFVSPRRRGVFGEVQLEAILRDVMHPGSYVFQHTLGNGKRVDCLLRLPEPVGDFAIDSKFPMDAYLQLMDARSSGGNDRVATPVDRRNESSVMEATKKDRVESVPMAEAAAQKKLGHHLRTHIRDIARKYIIPGETADSAILFLPSESIFAEVVTAHPDIITEAHRSRVWIACPTTLMAVLTTMQGAVRGMALTQQADGIVSQVGAIVEDIDRLIARAQKVEKNVEGARENLRLMRVSVDKVQRRKQKLDVLKELDFEVEHPDGLNAQKAASGDEVKPTEFLGEEIIHDSKK